MHVSGIVLPRVHNIANSEAGCVLAVVAASGCCTHLFHPQASLQDFLRSGSIDEMRATIVANVLGIETITVQAAVTRMITTPT
jgi:hypothetical protein